MATTETPLRLYRHTRFVRLWHWTTAVAIVIAILSGLLILNVHPRLYLGEVGNEHTAAWIELKKVSPPGAPMKTELKIGSMVIDTSGYLGADLAVGEATYFTIFPPPEDLEFGGTRKWHFLAGWMLALTWLAYVAGLLSSSRLRRKILPEAKELRPANLAGDLMRHLTFKRASGESARHYNTLQKITYSAVIVVLIPLVILSGLTMSHTVTALFPELFTLFGGRQSARTIHFLSMTIVVAFIAVHLVQAVIAGFWPLLKSMLTGYMTPGQEKK